MLTSSTGKVGDVEASRKVLMYLVLIGEDCWVEGGGGVRVRIF